MSKKRTLQQTQLRWSSAPAGDSRAERCLVTVISGGQTGADTAATNAATRIGFKVGGAKPSDSQRANYKSQLVARSMLNVDRSDGTVAFRVAESPGTDKTIGYCISGKWQIVQDSKIPKRSDWYRPLLRIDSFEDIVKSSELVAEFILENGVETLNVCGHRSDERALMPGYSMRVEQVMLNALAKVKKAQAPIAAKKAKQSLKFE